MLDSAPYRGLIMEHFRRPRNYGNLPNATAESEGSNPLCGDRVRLMLALDASGEQIREARFTANACAICIASASLLTERMRGSSVRSITTMTDEQVLAMLGGEIPAPRQRCATLPLEAARRALQRATDVSLQEGFTTAGRVVGLVLAAGSARRFGGPQKLLAAVPNGGDSAASLVRLSAILLRRAGLERVLVVVGREGDRVRERLGGLHLEIVHNESHAEGMSTSVVTGVRAALQRWPDTAGILIALGDQPLIDDRIVSRIVQAFASTAEPRIVAPRYRGVRGNPVLFSRDLADELLAIAGDQGARAVIERDAARVQYVDFDSEQPIDIDTPEDLRRFTAVFEERGEATP